VNTVTVYFGSCLDAQLAPALLAEILVAGELDQIAGEGVLAIGGHVDHIGATRELIDARYGRGTQLIGARARDVGGDLDTRVLGGRRLWRRLLCRHGTRHAAQREQHEQPTDKHE
jgi:hypothetical protein